MTTWLVVMSRLPRSYRRAPAEKEMGAASFKRQVAEPSMIKSFGFLNIKRSLNWPSLVLDKAAKRAWRREVNGVVGFDDGAPRAIARCVLSTWRAEDQDVFGLVKPSCRRLRTRRIDRRLNQSPSSCLTWENGRSQPYRHAGPRQSTSGRRPRPGSRDRSARPRGATEHGIETVGDISKSQPRELLDDTRVNDDAHWPPSTTAA